MRIPDTFIENSTDGDELSQNAASQNLTTPLLSCILIAQEMHFTGETL